MTVASERRAGINVRIRTAIVEGVAAVLGYSLVAVAVTWPLALHLQDRLLGPFPNDGAGGAAWYDQLHAEGGYHLFGITHHTLTGAPLGWDQGNALNFQWLLPNYPGYLAADVVGGTAALNLVILSGFALSGVAMYLLVRWLGCGRLVAAWAGLAFLVFPWHVQRAIAGHATLVHLEVFPLVLVAALAWLRRPSDRGGVFVALAIICTWMTSGYFGVMALFMVFGVAAVAVWTFRFESGLLGAVRRTIPLWGLAVVASVAFTVVSFLAGGTTGIRLGREAGDLSLYGAHLRDYLPDPLNPVAGAFAVDYLGRSAVDFGAESSLYPGLLTLVLAIAAVALLVRRRLVSTHGHGVVAAVLSVVVVALVMVAPNPMSVFGVDVRPMPSRLLLEVLPSFRVPTRFQAVFMTGLVPLAALALAQLTAYSTRRASSERAGQLLALCLCGAAMAVSVAELSISPVPMEAVGSEPPAYAAVVRTPTGVLAEYPLHEPGRFENSEYRFWQRSHGRPLLNTAGPGTEADALRRMLMDPAAPGTAAALAALGVSSIVTRPTTYRWLADSSAPDALSYGRGYELVGAVPSGVRVWRVAAEPAPGVAAYRWDDVNEPGERAADGFVGYQLAVPEVSLDLYAHVAGRASLRLDARAVPGVDAIVISGRGGGTVAVPLREGRASVRLPVALQRGRSTLTVTTVVSGGGLRGEKPVALVSAPRLEKAQQAGEALRPFPVSTDPGF